jgi:hypothetical protein
MHVPKNIRQFLGVLLFKQGFLCQHLLTCPINKITWTCRSLIKKKPNCNYVYHWLTLRILWDVQGAGDEEAVERQDARSPQLESSPALSEIRKSKRSAMVLKRVTKEGSSKHLLLVSQVSSRKPHWSRERLKLKAR